MTAIGRITKPQLRELEGSRNDSQPTPKAIRSVYFAENGCYADCPFYDRYHLAAGQLLSGPAIIVELDSTVVIHPGYQGLVDEFGNLIVTANSVATANP